MKINSEVKNNLLERKEVVVVVDHASTPTKVFFAEKLAEHFGVGIDQIVVNHVTNRFGAKSFTADAFVYDSLEAKNKYTRIKVKEAKK